MIKNSSTIRAKKEQTVTATKTNNSNKTRKRVRESCVEVMQKHEMKQSADEQPTLSKRSCAAEDSDIANRRKEFQEKNGWRPITDQMFPTPLKDGSDVENDDDVIVLCDPVTSPDRMLTSARGVLSEINADHTSHFRFRNIFVGIPCSSRPCPLPPVSWVDSEALWKSMVCKEPDYKLSSNYMARHADLQPRMRSILLDWIMEVCEVYTLHRETFYLAADYIDRYLTKTTNIHKTRLQLVGITALFIGAKLEEIYPPKLSEFAYVTDGACTEDEILSQELLMLSTLEWSLAPMTAVAWLNVYLQTAHTTFGPEPNAMTTFYLPQYPQETFVHITQLLDLCTLDIESLNFPSSVLAAAALYHFTSMELATRVSGYQFKDIALCVHWMAPFAITVRDTGLQCLRKFKRVEDCDSHNIQTHANNVDILDAAQQQRLNVQSQLSTCQSPTEMGGFMTPPKSGQKQNSIVDQHSFCNT